MRVLLAVLAVACGAVVAQSAVGYPTAVSLTSDSAVIAFPFTAADSMCALELSPSPSPGAFASHREIQSLETMSTSSPASVNITVPLESNPVGYLRFNGSSHRGHKLECLGSGTLQFAVFNSPVSVGAMDSISDVETAFNAATPAGVTTHILTSGPPYLCDGPVLITFFSSDPTGPFGYGEIMDPAFSVGTTSPGLSVSYTERERTNPSTNNGVFTVTVGTASFSWEFTSAGYPTAADLESQFDALFSSDFAFSGWSASVKAMPTAFTDSGLAVMVDEYGTFMFEVELMHPTLTTFPEPIMAYSTPSHLHPLAHPLAKVSMCGFSYVPSTGTTTTTEVCFFSGVHGEMLRPSYGGPVGDRTSTISIFGEETTMIDFATATPANVEMALSALGSVSSVFASSTDFPVGFTATYRLFTIQVTQSSVGDATAATMASNYNLMLTAYPAPVTSFFLRRGTFYSAPLSMGATALEVQSALEAEFGSYPDAVTVYRSPPLAGAGYSYTIMYGASLGNVEPLAVEITSGSSTSSFATTDTTQEGTPGVQGHLLYSPFSDFTVGGLLPDTTYYVRVNCYGLTGGAAAWNGWIYNSFTTSSDPTGPPPPSDACADPTNHIPGLYWSPVADMFVVGYMSPMRMPGTGPVDRLPTGEDAYPASVSTMYMETCD